MNDVLVKQYPLSGPAIGDRLVFERTGAYSVTEEFLFSEPSAAAGSAVFRKRGFPGSSKKSADGRAELRFGGAGKQAAD